MATHVILFTLARLYGMIIAVKNITRTLALASLIFILMSAPAFAQGTPAKQAAPQADAATTFDAEGSTLAAKKDKVSVGLRDTYTLLSNAYTRVQVAFARLSDKNIDTGNAQTELTLAGAALMNAKTGIDAFAKIVVPEDKTGFTAIMLKGEAKKNEDELLSVRTHLLASLASLKSALTAAIN
jgi:hypothetical protein